MGAVHVHPVPQDLPGVDCAREVYDQVQRYPNREVYTTRRDSIAADAERGAQALAEPVPWLEDQPGALRSSHRHHQQNRRDCIERSCPIIRSDRANECDKKDHSLYIFTIIKQQSLVIIASFRFVLLTCIHVVYVVQRPGACTKLLPCSLEFAQLCLQLPLILHCIAAVCNAPTPGLHLHTCYPFLNSSETRDGRTSASLGDLRLHRQGFSVGTPCRRTPSPCWGSVRIISSVVVLVFPKVGRRGLLDFLQEVVSVQVGIRLCSQHRVVHSQVRFRQGGHALLEGA
mmetsp:Transcript_40174/g.126425  ORF Transcript_40174/g.126425 Transcript_40174/m.126425 type:complete len:286 (+) Transcript_40174:1970-2827(+)